MTEDSFTTGDRRTVLRSIGAASLSPAILSRATKAGTDALPSVHYSSVGIVYDMDREIDSGDPLIRTCVLSHPMLHEGQILTRRATEEMRADLVANDRVVHHKDTHPVPVDHLGGTDTSIVPINLTDDLRPGFGFRLDDSVRLPRVVVVGEGHETKVTVPGVETTSVPVGEQIGIELDPVRSTFSKRGEQRQRTVEFGRRVVAKNHGDMTITE